MALELEVRVPGGLPDGPVEEGMDVVEEAREARVFDGREAAARHVAPLEAEHLEPGPAEVGLQDEAVVTGAEDDPVVVAGSSRAGRSRSREALAAAEDAAGLAEPRRTRPERPSGDAVLNSNMS